MVAPSNSRHSLIFVMGPTASGKSQWALNLAKKFNGVIFNCDSVQLYKSVHIGSAKPTQEEMEQAPHYLYDIVDEGVEITAGEYSRIFYQTLQKIPETIPIFVVGGTGFYFLAIEKGMYGISRTNENIKNQVEQEMSEPDGPQKLYSELLKKDPAYAAKISKNDHYRIGRAVEILRSENKTVTEVQSEFELKKTLNEKNILKIGLHWERDLLKERIRQRVGEMLSHGLVEEVQSLLNKNLKDWAPMKSVGYRETVEFLDDNRSVDWLKEEIYIHTCQLAKKQKTWFKKDSQIHWFEGADEYKKAENIVHFFLRKS